MKKLILLIILIPNLAFGESMKMIGEKGDPSEIDRIIEVKMYDNCLLYTSPSPRD